MRKNIAKILAITTTISTISTAGIFFISNVKFNDSKVKNTNQINSSIPDIYSTTQQTFAPTNSNTALSSMDQNKNLNFIEIPSAPQGGRVIFDYKNLTFYKERHNNSHNPNKPNTIYVKSECHGKYILVNKQKNYNSGDAFSLLTSSFSSKAKTEFKKIQSYMIQKLSNRNVSIKLDDSDTESILKNMYFYHDKLDLNLELWDSDWRNRWIYQKTAELHTKSDSITIEPWNVHTWQNTNNGVLPALKINYNNKTGNWEHKNKSIMGAKNKVSLFFDTAIMRRLNGRLQVDTYVKSYDKNTGKLQIQFDLPKVSQDASLFEKYFKSQIKRSKIWSDKVLETTKKQLGLDLKDLTKHVNADAVKINNLEFNNSYAKMKIFFKIDSNWYESEYLISLLSDATIEANKNQIKALKKMKGLDENALATTKAKKLNTKASEISKKITDEATLKSILGIDLVALNLEGNTITSAVSAKGKPNGEIDISVQINTPHATTKEKTIIFKIISYNDNSISANIFQDKALEEIKKLDENALATTKAKELNAKASEISKKITDEATLKSILGIDLEIINFGKNITIESVSAKGKSNGNIIINIVIDARDAVTRKVPVTFKINTYADVTIDANIAQIKTLKKIKGLDENALATTKAKELNAKASEISKKITDEATLKSILGIDLEISNFGKNITIESVSAKGKSNGNIIINIIIDVRDAVKRKAPVTFKINTYDDVTIDANIAQIKTLKKIKGLDENALATTKAKKLNTKASEISKKIIDEATLKSILGIDLGTLILTGNTTIEGVLAIGKATGEITISITIKTPNAVIDKKTEIFKINSYSDSTIKLKNKLKLIEKNGLTDIQMSPILIGVIGVAGVLLLAVIFLLIKYVNNRT